MSVAPEATLTLPVTETNQEACASKLALPVKIRSRPMVSWPEATSESAAIWMGVSLIPNEPACPGSTSRLNQMLPAVWAVVPR